MKIAIIGPGALGSLFAALLTKHKSKDNEIWLLDKDEKRAVRLNRQGIAVEGVAGNWQAAVKVTADPAGIGTSDLVILCVKSYDTKAAMTRAQALIGDATAVLTVQNGIGNVELIGEVAGPEKVIGGVTNLGVTLLEAGKIRYCGKGDTVIGKIDGKTSVQMRAIRELFNGAGLDTRISQDIKGFLWSKLVINAGINPLTALTRLSNGKLLDYPGARKLLREAVTEAVKIAKRKRIKLLYDDPLAKVEAVCEATADNMSSMLQDVLHAKRTEIDAINGVVVRFGQELGVTVPVNSTLVDLIKTIESSYSAQE
ncbi:MAG TPA: 2-dehydropantoate 2-reductase [Candidatus Omnitrophota bacterium]|nr:2-dehydropantoate 2-reductase [Candidatus Omnitrophota bacterium]HRZ14887.1 2-dehydropantoate 2-reductase [Candidatus Omnitrophota bacterium]